MLKQRAKEIKLMRELGIPMEDDPQNETDNPELEDSDEPSEEK